MHHELAHGALLLHESAWHIVHRSSGCILLIQCCMVLLATDLTVLQEVRGLHAAAVGNLWLCSTAVGNCRAVVGNAGSASVAFVFVH